MKENIIPGLEAGAWNPRGGVEAVLLLTMLFAFSYFFHPALYDNALSRLDLTYALVLESRTEIDTWHMNTLDKAQLAGKDGTHYYSDKAPGLSFAAAPVLSASLHVFKFKNATPNSPLPAYLLTFFTVALPVALSFMLLFRLVREVSGSEACGACTTLFMALGTICYTYSTQFYGHMFAAALLIAALYAVLSPALRGGEASAPGLALCGFLLGAAVVSDYPSAAPGALIAGFAFFSSPRKVRVLSALAAGAAMPVAGLLAYNNSVFGSPFAIGYFKEVSSYYYEGMSKGLGGVTAPKPSALVKLLFAPERGLLWGAPFLAFAVPAAFMPGSGVRKRAALLCTACFVSVLLINAGYYEPYGGFAPGPRFLSGALPFLAVTIGAAWPRFSGSVKAAFAAFGVAGVAVNVLLNAVEPHVPHMFAAPVVQFALPLLRSGFLYENLGASLLGLKGVYSFVPLAVVLLVSAVVIVKMTRARFAGVCIAALFAVCLAIICGTYYFAGNAMPGPKEGKYYLSETWVRRGLVYYRGGNAYESERSFIAAIDEHPYWAQPYISLAALYIGAGKPEAAATVLKRASQLGYNKEVERLLEAVSGKGAR